MPRFANKTYAIASPGGGFKEDIPAILIADAYTPGSPTKNVVFESGCIEKEQGRLRAYAQDIPDNGEINMIAEFEQSDGSRYLIVGTKDKIYSRDWDVADWTDITGANVLTGDETDFWSFVQYGDVFLMTNGIDPMYKWTGAGNIEVVGGSPPVCRFVTVFKDYVVAIKLDGEPHKFAWSAIGEFEVWDDGDAGSAVVDDSYPIVGYTKMFDFLIFFKQFGTYLAEFIGSPLIFRLQKRIERVGAVGPHSIVTLNDRSYFLGQGKEILMYDRVDARTISDPIEETMSRIEDDNVELVFGFPLDPLGKVVWLVPLGDTERCNAMIIFDTNMGNWFVLEDIDSNVIGVGRHASQEVTTWQDLIDDGVTWADLLAAGTRWDDLMVIPGERIYLTGGEESVVYRLFSGLRDKGAVFPGVWVTKKIGFERMNVKKRILYMQHYFKNEMVDYNVNVSMRLDNSPSFINSRTFGLNAGTQDEFIIFEHPIDVVCKTLQLKIEGKDRWRYIGTIFYYNDQGTR